MIITQETLIFNQLLIDLKKINTIRLYRTKPVVIIPGLPPSSYFVNRPALCYWAYLDEIVEETKGSRVTMNWLSFILRGYTDDDIDSKYVNIRNLRDDVKQFIYSDDWTYTNKTETGNMLVVPGDIDKGHAEFDYRFRVSYTGNCAS